MVADMGHDSLVSYAVLYLDDNNILFIFALIF